MAPGRVGRFRRLTPCAHRRLRLRAGARRASPRRPIEPRDAARLLVDRGPARDVEHRQVRDLPGLLEPGDLVVVNDTRVLPARLHLQRATGGHVEVLLLEPLDDQQRRWSALARPAKRLRPGERLLGPTGGRSSTWSAASTTASRCAWSARSTRWRSCSAWARCRSRPTSRSRWPMPSATRPSTPPGPVPWRHPPPGSTSRRASSPGWRSAASRSPGSS